MKKRVGGRWRGMLDEEHNSPNTRPHGSGTVVYQSNWNIKLTIIFLPCYYRNLSCVKEVAGEMVTS
jgi:hypothetical protein